MPRIAAILPAAGKSSRFRDPHYKKPFALLAERAVWLHAAEKFLNHPDVCQTIVVISEEDEEYFQMKFSANVAILGIQVVLGGKTRSDSVHNALKEVRDEAELVAVHDAARPLIVKEWIDKVFDEAARTGAAILATPIVGTVKRASDKQTISETVPRVGLWEAQTPQVFRKDWLLEAYQNRDASEATDDAQLVERLGHAVHVVEGSRLNFKITTKEDLHHAQYAMSALPKPKLDGPFHPFADDDKWR